MKKIRVGLTGGIATGKSTVLAEFKKLGAETVSTDALAHEILAERRFGAKVRRLFGPDVLDAAGRVDRKALGRLVFARPAALGRLERLLHPEILKRASAREKASRKGVVVTDVPLLFEKGLGRRYDLTLVVYAEPGQQKRRLLKRDGMRPSEAARRIALQWPIERKAALADVVLDNTGTPAAVRRTARQYYSAFRLISGGRGERG